MKFSLIALLGLLSLSAYSTTCKYNVCVGQKVYFLDLENPYTIKGFTNNHKVNLTELWDPYYASSLYAKYGSDHIGKTYKVKNGVAKYILKAINLKDKNKFMGKLSTNGELYEINLNELIVTKAIASDKWTDSKTLNRENGIYSSEASIRKGNHEVSLSCTTLDSNVQLAIKVSTLVGRASLYTTKIANEELQVTLSIKGKGKQSITTRDYTVLNENLIIKEEALSQDIVDSLQTGNSFTVKIEGVKFHEFSNREETERLSRVEFSLTGSQNAIQEMQDICAGNF